MRRREFITLLGGTAATWPLAARAQQPVRVRRIGALMSIAENDSQSTVWSSAFERGLTDHGWKPGQDLQIEYRGPTTKISTDDLRENCLPPHRRLFWL